MRLLPNIDLGTVVKFEHVLCPHRVYLRSSVGFVHVYTKAVSPFEQGSGELELKTMASPDFIARCEFRVCTGDNLNKERGLRVRPLIQSHTIGSDAIARLIEELENPSFKLSVEFDDAVHVRRLPASLRVYSRQPPPNRPNSQGTPANECEHHDTCSFTPSQPSIQPMDPPMTGPGWVVESSFSRPRIRPMTISVHSPS